MRSTTSRSQSPSAEHQAANSCPRYAPSAQILREAWQQWGESGEQALGTFTIVEIGRGDVDRQQEAKCIHENVALASLNMLMWIKPANAGRLLDRFHADVASMIAALGCAFLPTRSRSAVRKAVSRRNQIPLRRKRRKW